MATGVPALDGFADAAQATEWIDAVVGSVGGGFHFDTPPEDYRTPGGRRLFDAADARRLAAGLIAARRILGDRRFESRCLAALWSAMGCRYDPRRGRLVRHST